MVSHDDVTEFNQSEDSVRLYYWIMLGEAVVEVRMPKLTSMKI